LFRRCLRAFVFLARRIQLANCALMRNAQKTAGDSEAISFLRRIYEPEVKSREELLLGVLQFYTVCVLKTCKMAMIVANSTEFGSLGF
jgi:hypothetical protein